MKNLKATGFFVVALLTGLGAAVYAAGWASQKAQGNGVKVVVAAADIEMGSKLEAAMLTTLDWPGTAIPPGAFRDIKELQDRVLKISVLQGEPVIDGKLTPKGTQTGLSAVIAEGKRAMTVRVNDVIGVAGFALPGTHVDVMVNMQREQDGGVADDKRISKTVLERVLVLAVAQESSRDETKPKLVTAVTLELSLGDAEKLDLARSVGTLSLVLRNQFDKTSVKTTGITKKELFGLVEAAPAAAAPAIRNVPKPVVAKSTPAPVCVDIYQNGSKSPNCF